MKKYLFIITFFLALSFSFVLLRNKKEEIKYQTIEGEILGKQNDMLVFKDVNDLTYFIKDSSNVLVGDKVILEYTGLIDRSKATQDIEVVGYTKLTNSTYDDLSVFNDNGIFSKFYKQAYNKLQQLTLDEKIGQVLLARYPESKEGNKYNLSGYIFYEKDFQNKSKAEVLEMIDSLNDTAKIPLLLAVDEEGGKIVRASSNNQLISEPFKGSKELYDAGGLDLIREDTIKKSEFLSSLHLNVNLAPVLDIASNAESYIYPRTIGYGVEVTSKYAQTVVNASKTGSVSYVLKHFPGYGDNLDTHEEESVDNTNYNDLLSNNIAPFKTGIDNGAEAVLISHNIFTSIDEEPASLSSGIHNILKSTLNFTGVTVTDDLDMGATKDYNNKYLSALLAGNDLLIVTNYEDAYNEIKKGIEEKNISEDYLDKLVFKVLAWKYYKLLLLENNK